MEVDVRVKRVFLKTVDTENRQTPKAVALCRPTPCPQLGVAALATAFVA